MKSDRKKVRIMKKWYLSSRLLLVAAVSVQLAGCASTSRTVSRWMGREQPTEQVAKSDSKDTKESKKSTEAATVAKKSADKPTAKSATDTQTAQAKKSSTTPEKEALRAEVVGKVEREKATTLASAKQTADEKGTVQKAASQEVADLDEFPFASVETKPKNSPKAAAPTLDPFADFPIERVAARSETPAGTATVPKFESHAGEIPPETGGLKPRSASSSIARGTQRLTETPQVAVATDRPNRPPSAAAASGLPVWALDEEDVRTPQVEISQTSATAPKAPEPSLSTLQPGKPVPASMRLPVQETTARGTRAYYASLCPAATGEVRDLVQSLDTADNEGLKRSIHRLGRLQAEGVAAAPALRQLLKHPDGLIRVHASLALVRMQQTGSDVTQTLVDSLRSKDPAIRSFAAAVLAEMGPHSIEALPALSAGLNDPDAYVRLHAAEVLIRHDDWSQHALMTINKSLLSSDENVRWLATYSLAELAPQSEESVAALAKCLRDPVTKVQIGAAYALGEIGPVASSALPQLEWAAQHPNGELRTAAEYAITQIRK